MSKFMKKIRRSVSAVLVFIITAMLVFPHILVLEARAERKYNPGDTMLSMSEDWDLYCIDGYEVLGEAGGILGENEWYAYVLPSTQLSKNDRNILFWATLSMMGNSGEYKELSTIYNNINNQAASVGLRELKPAVTESDLKAIIHKPSVLKKYTWINDAIANAEAYMKLGGIIGSASTTSTGGKAIPTVLQNHTDLSSALQVDGTFTIQFDAGGADKEFINTVPLEFSADGSDGSWDPNPIGGWTYQKTDTAIIFSNPNPQPSKILIRFNTTGTAYAASSSQFTSVEDAYENGLQLWVCIICNNVHATREKTQPLEAHQRMVYMEVEPAYAKYFAAIGTDPVPALTGSGLVFNVYRHEDDMVSTYNVQMRKHDDETGETTEDAVFKLYERFDDKGEIDTEKDGAVHIYEGGDPYQSYHTDNPVIWDNFRYVASVSTDEDGYASKTINHGYHYDKTFCDGHPAPTFVSVPDEEYDDEGDLENGAEIDAAQAENAKLAQAWLDCVASCEDHASGDYAGVHFHWIMSSVNTSTISSVASTGGSPGDTPNGGTTTSATGEEAYEKSGCKQDCEDTYHKFISLKYSYTWVEYTAREGYIRHDLHADDIPIEVITTDASENGANSTFANMYSKDITINQTSSLSSRLLTMRSLTAARVQETAETESTEQTTSSSNESSPIAKTVENYIQQVVSLYVPGAESTETDPDEEPDVIEIINDLEDATTATASNATVATASNAKVASASNLVRVEQIAFTASASNASSSSNSSASSMARSALSRISQSQLFTSAYNAALNGGSYGNGITPGDDSNYSHCNDADGEGNIWRIYDHRTEGEIHINKRDMELQDGETADYDSYGDSQGDGTVEGAVYGLFAAADIIHPDGKTGTVYKANNLVAVSTTDKNGDASFLSYTEAPGYRYDYETGTIVTTDDGWASAAPSNLYTSNASYDDYTIDGQYKRIYTDNEANNGNCWIGRPLILGDYYVKELSRSEGYELSIGNRKNENTNLGQDFDVTIPEGTGYATITKNLYAEGQIDSNPTGEYGDPDYDELFFFAKSQETGTDGFDVVLNNIPAGAKFYRLDSSTETITVQVGTGVYDKVYLTNSDGSPKYVVAENDYQYPKYNSDGSIMTVDTATNYIANQFLSVTLSYLDSAKTLEAIESEETAMTQAEVQAKLITGFTVSDLYFLKGKVEKALRKNGKYSPKVTSSGTTEYSSIYAGVFDEGVREGETDYYGVSGVTPGTPAAKTVYGSPVITLELSKTDGSGNPITVGDAILSVLDFYNTNSFYNYGGVHSIEEESDKFLITVYASQYGNPENFIVLGTDEEDDSVIYHRVEYLSTDTSISPRYVYVTYSNNSAYDAFGTYEDFSSEWIGSRYYATATLITEATIQDDGTIVTKTVAENVYYQTGEIPYDADGNRIQAFEYVEQTTDATMEVEVYQWVGIPVTEVDGKLVIHLDSSYTDAYGVSHTDDDLQSYAFRVVVPEKKVTLTAEDIAAMYDSGTWSAGDQMGGAAYYLQVKAANAKVYLNYANMNITGDNSYVQTVALEYPGDTYIWQDGEGKPGTNTRENPVGVQERAIKQQIKVTKEIDTGSYENTNSYSEVHEDDFTTQYGASEAAKMPNFRFKTYLKSNLERLYRDEDGNVVWQDKKGNEIDILSTNEAFPALVSKIYTRAPHETDPLYQDSNDAVIHNYQLYDYTGDFINEDQNTGYTAILETTGQLVEDGSGTRVVQEYNYEKFFDAIQVANKDKWDDAAPTYTSHQPIGNEANRTAYTLENAKASDMVRQFAITWYLDDEIAKLVQEVPAGTGEKEDADSSVAYSDELYDEALYQAIQKAENYLKPFFAYDLDEIYSIAWDSAAGGGTDSDPTTLSADVEDTDYYYNTSEYLPYGVYVVVEQQPQYDSLEDFTNRHYQTDEPREVTVPTAYATYAGSQSVPEELNDYYNYDAASKPEDMAANYQIRYNEESHVIQAHNHYGDYEIYKYGLELDRIQNGVPGSIGSGDYFSLTQGYFQPVKSYYNMDDDRTTGNIPYYLSEGQSGREEISKYYRFSSVSEGFGIANDVPYPGAAVTDDNWYGIQYQDNVQTMQGILTAYDGKYAAMLVPYTITAPLSTDTEEDETAPAATGESSYVGYAYDKFINRLFTSKLRIEKLDSETHENILHDDAIFAIYAAKRNDSPDGDGSVLFYETDTRITGTKEFLEAMGATDIEPTGSPTWLDRLTGKKYGDGTLYVGTVPAGTPVCEESEQIILGDGYGNQTVAFKAYSTVFDGLMKDEDSNSSLTYQNQTVGYLETPQPLSAGVYVVAEMKAPTGYTRSKPVAVEVYSDKVSYYKEGNRDERVLAAIYENPADNLTTNGNKPQDVVKVSRINIENAPIKLTVEKVKESSADTAETTADKTVTYKVSGRVDGTLAEIGNDTSLVYAYDENGTYQGYAWKKGTLEQLAARKEAGEDVELAYEGSIFAGYGFVTRTLETADDTNQYVVGATMTLFDALELNPSGNTEDYAYEGLTIERNRTNNVTRMYVKSGYAGEKVEFVKEKDENGQEYTVTYEAGIDQFGNPIMETGNIWTAETIQRPDTDILYYDLSSLDLFTTKTIEGTSVTYGYDENHTAIPLTTLESDKANFDKTDTEYSIYAFSGGIPYLEFVGGDFTQISYSSSDKIITVGAGTRIYHIDRDGNRDALVDPYTGMAYITETQSDGSEKILVWAVNVRKDAYGNVIARDKITTSRIATVGENQDGYADYGTIEVTNNSGATVQNPTYSHEESGYITGSWNSEAGEESHQETSVDTNSNGHNMNDSVLMDDNNGSFDKDLNPVYDEHGLPSYYQRSRETYDKGTDLYDRNDDFVRYQDSDNLEEYNKAAYRINEHDELYDGVEDQESQTQNALYHRQGEAYILENTWVTSDKTPNDPFDTQETDGQADILKRVPSGTYIMEELISPVGKSKGIPVGLTVLETAEMQSAKMVDKTIKTEISKIDGTEDYTVDRVDMNSGTVIGQVTEGKGRYGYGQVSEANIAMYPAERIYTAEGSYLVKTADTPITFKATDHMISAIRELTASWTTGSIPLYIEGLPEGEYLLEEIGTPGNQGFVTSDPVEVVITSSRNVQLITMFDDHTKLEIDKYQVIGEEKTFLIGAGFTLFNADAGDQVVDNWITDDATDYTDTIELSNYPNTNGSGQTGFGLEFEAMYKQYGTQSGTSFGWSVERSASRSSTSDTVWVMEDGTRIAIVNGVINYPSGMNQADMDGFLAAYDSNSIQANTIKWAVERSAAYVSHSQLDSGNSTSFPTAAELYFETDNGEIVRIVVYEGTADRQGRNFTFEYQYDYKKLDTINDYACSYLTADGSRRLDYLPVGMNLRLEETTVPEGYAKAEDVFITILDTAQIQYYGIENEVSALRISKVSGTGTKEFAGNELALYTAAADGSFQQETAYLMTSWISGMDGTYTEFDFINGRIPDGYSQGDLKPHTITGLDDGIYYVAELTSADYYTLFEPIRIDYKGEDEIQIVRVSNQVAEGELEIIKTDAEGINGLSGAVFEVSAYLQGSREALFTKTVSTVDGKAVLTGLPVGRLLSDGSIEPYQYKVKEVTPPDGFAVNTLIETFTFSADNNGSSYEYGEKATYTITVKNETTKLYIEKRDFEKLQDSGIDGIFVEGAELAIYELLGRDADGNILYDENDPFTEWITQATERHLVEGLIAGTSYVLVEKKAPKGYTTMQPVILTVSQDGRKITTITNSLNTVTVNTIQVDDYDLDFDNPDVDSIQSITIQGRYATRVINVITDESGNELVRWNATGNGYDLYPSVVPDETLCTITEITRYSDGSERSTGKVTRRIYYKDNTSYHLEDRTLTQNKLALAYTDGTIIHEYEPKEYFDSATIQNNVNPENPKITLNNRATEPGDALISDQAVFGSIFYVNTSHTTTDVTVTAMLDPSMTILETNGGSQLGNWITWTIEDVSPLQGGYVTFAAEINNPNVYQASVIVLESINGTSKGTTKTVPVLQPNKLTIYNELTGSGKTIHQGTESQYEVYLYSEQGEELKGSYEYDGSRSGMVKSGDVITLSGNEFITIDPGTIYKNIRYEVVRIEDGLEADSWNTSGTAAADTGAAAIFTRWVPDTSEREIFVKGEEYILTETTGYSDGEQLQSNKFKFMISDDGGINGVGGYDKETKTTASKQDFATGEELPGATIVITDKDGNGVDEWVSGEEPHEISGLEPGQEYTMTETSPPDGFAYAEEITFTVNEDGTIDTIVMEDKPNTEHIYKLATASNAAPNYEYSGNLEGAVLQILDENKQPVKAIRDDALFKAGDDLIVTTTTEFTVITKQLIADKSYFLHEITPPAGYALSDDILFTVSHYGEIDTIIMYDVPTVVILSKQEITGSEELSGGHYLVKDKDGNVIYEYEADGTPHEVTGLLIAGETYWFVEDLSPIGYAYAEAVEFTVSMDGSIDYVVMYDKPTHIEVNKVNTSDELLGGAIMQILDDQKTVVLEFETVAGEVFEIVATLVAGATYTLHEKTPPAGYQRAKDITFTVSRDGSMDTITMIDYKITGGGGGGGGNTPKTPSTPETPAPETPEEKVGRIVAEYDSNIDSEGRLRLTTGPTPKTGVEGNIMLYAALTAINVIGLIAVVYMAVKGKKKKIKYLTAKPEEPDEK